MKNFILLFVFFYPVRCLPQTDTSQIIISGRKNSPLQQKKPYVILISSDGFRYDYARKYNATNLIRLSKNGVSAKSMRPSFPSLTFPNHYSIATGLYPSHHGLIGNYYYDRKLSLKYGMADSNSVTDGNRYGGLPLWVLAEQQQMLTASFYWVGTEADIRKTRPTYYYKYNEKIPINKRIQVVLDWLNLPEDVRPHFITFYMPETDDAGHDFGPDSPQTRDAVRFVDSTMKKLTEAINITGLPVNYIFLADHGMSDINTSTPITIKTIIDTNKFITIPGGQIYQIYAKNTVDIMPLYSTLKSNRDRYKVYLKKDMPRSLKYAAMDDYYNRIGDIIIMPEWPNVIKYSTSKLKPGAHGYDPFKVKEMHAVFFAWGPAFKKNMVIETFDNVQIYSVITGILGLSVNEKIDGNKKLARKILH